MRDWLAEAGDALVSVFFPGGVPNRLTAPEAWRCMSDPLLRAILRLKFEPIEPLGAWFAGRLAKLVNAEGSKLSADVVVPVPLHG